MLLSVTVTTPVTDNDTIKEALSFVCDEKHLLTKSCNVYYHVGDCFCTYFEQRGYFASQLGFITSILLSIHL
jgi:hypothetical protein